MRLAQGAFEELADAALGKVRGFADLLQGKPLAGVEGRDEVFVLPNPVYSVYEVGAQLGEAGLGPRVRGGRVHQERPILPDGPVLGVQAGLLRGVSKIGRRALALSVDLASEVETAGAVGRTVEALGRVDVLVNAAGTDSPGTVEELDVEGWDRTLAVNLHAPFLLSKAAFPRMREAGGGTIINVS